MCLQLAIYASPHRTGLISSIKTLTSQSVMMLSCLQHTNFDILPVRCYISYTGNLPLQSTLQFKAIVANSSCHRSYIHVCTCHGHKFWVDPYIRMQPSHVYLVSTLITRDVCTPLFSSLAEEICMSHLTIGDAVFYTFKLSQFFVVHA